MTCSHLVEKDGAEFAVQSGCVILSSAPNGLKCSEDKPFSLFK